MTTWDDDVQIRRAPWGAVTIEPEGFPTDAISQAAIPVVGGTLFVDVTRPSRPPRASIIDPYWAQTWLPGVYGEEVADDIARFEDPAHDQQLVRTPVRDYLSDAVERLGVGFWLHRWWPSGTAIPELDERLLELEIGALAWYAEALFVDLEPTIALLEPHCDFLVEQVEALRESGVGTSDESDFGILRTALQAVDELLDESTPGVEACRSLLEALLQEDVTVSAAVGAVDWSAPVAELWDRALSALPTPEPALIHMGGDATDAAPLLRAVLNEIGTVDPLQVPPRTVRGNTDNLRWTLGLDDDDNVVVDVRVEAAGAPDGVGFEALVARIHVGGPAQVLVLEHDPAQRAFVGFRRLSLTRMPAEAPFIDVCDPAYLQRPRTDRAEVQRDIESIAAFTLQRLRGIAAGTESGFIAERKARLPDA